MNMDVIAYVGHKLDSGLKYLLQATDPITSISVFTMHVETQIDVWPIDLSKISHKRIRECVFEIHSRADWCIQQIAENKNVAMVRLIL